MFIVIIILLFCSVRFIHCCRNSKDWSTFCFFIDILLCLSNTFYLHPTIVFTYFNFETFKPAQIPEMKKFHELNKDKKILYRDISDICLPCCLYVRLSDTFNSLNDQNIKKIHIL